MSIGGDPLIGSTYAELMPLFEADEETDALVIYTEPGGPMDAQLSLWVKENKSRLPIVAFMAGKFMDKMPGMRFGHAGTIVEARRTRRRRSWNGWRRPGSRWRKRYRRSRTWCARNSVRRQETGG